jgi:hypothetical protein
MAVTKLASLAGPVDRVVLAHAYDVGQWLPLAYQALCEREECLSDEDGLKLGIHDVLKIARLRVAMRSGRVILDGPARTMLVRDAFKPVEKPDPSVLFSVASTEEQVINTPLVIPAAALPFPTEDIALSPLPRKLFVDTKAAVALVINAQHKLQLIRSVFEPLADGIRAELSTAQQVPGPFTRAGRPGLASREYSMAQYFIETSNRQLALYTEQIKAAEDEVEHAKAAVASLVSQAFLSTNTL